MRGLHSKSGSVARLAALMVLTVLQVHAGPVEKEPPPRLQGVVGVRKLATGVNDCASVVAFSGTGARAVKDDHPRPLSFLSAALDKGVGWSKDSGEFTCHCPGLYQFSFAGGAKMSLKKQTSGSDTWVTIVSTSTQGGANTVLLDMEIGDKTAVWMPSTAVLPDEEEDSPTSSFSGYRIAKK